GFPKSPAVTLPHLIIVHRLFSCELCKAARIVVGKKAECKVCRSSPNYRLVYPHPSHLKALAFFFMSKMLLHPLH
ncbi:Uncharacterized protein DAT39_000366, partial [Clarias magur]